MSKKKNPMKPLLIKMERPLDVLNDLKNAPPLTPEQSAKVLRLAKAAGCVVLFAETDKDE